MEKYQRVAKEKVPTAEDEIRISAAGKVSAYITYAAQLFKEQDKVKVVINATGNAIPKAVQVAEVIKRRFEGLHQTCEIGSTDIENEYEPLEEGLDVVKQVKTMSTMSITLSKEELDTSHIGYQAPIDPSEVTDEVKPERRPRKGKGEKGEKGEGKGDREDKPKGKGKGKGKKGKDDRDSSPKGKGKGKGKSDEKGKKGKGKGKGKSKGWDDGWGQSWSKPTWGWEDPWAAPKGKGKGKKGKGKSKGWSARDW